MSELKPCPFCGGEASVWNSGNIYVSCVEYRVCCLKCHVTQGGGSHYSENEAREAWNRRVDNA